MVLFTGASVEEAIQNGLRELDIPRMKAHIKVISREKKGFLGLFGKKLAQVDVESINETTVVKANQKAVKGVPEAINAQNEPVKSVSEATVDLGHVVAAIKKIEGEGKEISDDVKAEILKHEKEASTILEETGTIDLLKDSDIVNFQKSVAQEEKTTDKIISFDQAVEKRSEVQPIAEESADFEDLGIQVEENYDVEEVVASVTGYVQNIVDEMDVEASIASTHNRRTINMQIDTNEPGRIIGYHGKVLKALQLLAQNYLYNRYYKSFYISINVNDYVEHRAEVLQSYAQKLADRVLEYQHSQKTDPMSNNERKIIHRIISKMDGLTSYSEGDEPNRYVVVDIDSE